MVQQHSRLSLQVLAVHIDAEDFHGGVGLAMSVQLFVLLLALKVEDENLVAAAMLDHLSGDERFATACPVRLRSR